MSGDRAFAAFFRHRWAAGMAMREIVNAIFYVLRGGIPWRMLPSCSPRRQTVYGWFAAWRNAGVWQLITHHLVMLNRELVGREANPLCRCDRLPKYQDHRSGRSPWLRCCEQGARPQTPCDGVDSDGRLLCIQVYPASAQESRRCHSAAERSRCSFPFVQCAFADSAYAVRMSLKQPALYQDRPQTARANRVRRASAQVDGGTLFAWLSRNRRLAKDLEATITQGAIGMARSGGYFERTFSTFPLLDTSEIIAAHRQDGWA